MCFPGVPARIAPEFRAHLPGGPGFLGPDQRKLWITRAQGSRKKIRQIRFSLRGHPTGWEFQILFHPVFTGAYFPPPPSSRSIAFLRISPFVGNRAPTEIQILQAPRESESETRAPAVGLKINNRVRVEERRVRAVKSPD